jgi:hypothetical protein
MPSIASGGIQEIAVTEDSIRTGPAYARPLDPICGWEVARAILRTRQARLRAHGHACDRPATGRRLLREVFGDAIGDDSGSIAFAIRRRRAVGRPTRVRE